MNETFWSVREQVIFQAALQVLCGFECLSWVVSMSKNKFLVPLTKMCYPYGGLLKGLGLNLQDLCTLFLRRAPSLICFISLDNEIPKYLPV